MQRKVIISKKKAVQPTIIKTSTPASPAMLFTPQRKFIFSRRTHRYSKSHVAIPTQITRTSPFQSISKRKVRKQWIEERTFENSWGKWKMKGAPLSIFDMKITLAISMLIYNERWSKPRSEILTTQYELCKILGVNPTSIYYKRIWKSLERLAETTANLDSHNFQMVGSLIWIKRDKTTNKIRIRSNSFFDKMFAREFLTRLNYTLFLSIKGDTAKLLYAFLQSQATFYNGGWYRIGLVKLCEALNIETKNIPLWTLRSKIKKVIAPLVNEKYVSQSSCIHTDDVVHFHQSYKWEGIIFLNRVLLYF